MTTGGRFGRTRPIWPETNPVAHHAKLDQDRQANVCIVGPESRGSPPRICCRSRDAL